MMLLGQTHERQRRSYCLWPDDQHPMRKPTVTAPNHTPATSANGTRRVPVPAGADRLTDELSQVLARLGGRCAELSMAVRTSPPSTFNGARMLVAMQVTLNELESIDVSQWGTP